MAKVVDNDGYRVLQFTEKQWREDPEFVNCVGVTLDKIRADNHLDMSFWLAADRYVAGASHDDPCGTAGCLAGHAFLALVAPPVRTVGDYRRLFARTPVEEWYSHGSRLLGIAPTDADMLFVTDRWPRALREQYNLAELEPGALQQRARFNALVGAVEWMIRKRSVRRQSRKR